MRSRDQTDDLEFVGGEVSQSWSFPSPLMLFLSKRFFKGELGDKLFQIGKPSVNGACR